MAISYKMKTCSISGKKLRANNKNFYVNNSSSDGLHPYSKRMDNMRRTLGVSVDKVKDLVNLINS
jgi:hypothetical protein